MSHLQPIPNSLGGEEGGIRYEHVDYLTIKQSIKIDGGKGGRGVNYSTWTRFS